MAIAPSGELTASTRLACIELVHFLPVEIRLEVLAGEHDKLPCCCPFAEYVERRLRTVHK